MKKIEVSSIHSKKIEESSVIDLNKPIKRKSQLKEDTESF